MIFIPLDMTQHNSPGSTLATVTLAPALTSVSTMHVVSISSLPCPIGTRTDFSALDMDNEGTLRAHRDADRQRGAVLRRNPGAKPDEVAMKAICVRKILMEGRSRNPPLNQEELQQETGSTPKIKKKLASSGSGESSIVFFLGGAT